MKKEIKNEIEQNRFTIQNVPIKLKKKEEKRVLVSNLQYKMFLLNWNIRRSEIKSKKIYNTKCSY